MIKTSTLLTIQKDCLSAGFEVKVRDIAYILLCKQFSDDEVAYKCLFPNDDNFKEYDESAPITYLRNYFTLNSDVVYGRVDADGDRIRGEEDEITFEENRRGLIQLLKDTQEALDDHMIEPKDAYKIMADIRLKLNNHFDVKEDVKDHVVIVNQKFNSTCDYCKHEIYIPTKEDLMKQYNLIEK